MTQSFDLAQSYIFALTGSPDTVMDFRCIHDTDKSVPAHNYRGTLRDQWATLVGYNQRGYGIFTCINEMDGQGRELSNIRFIRTHAIDLDDELTVADSYARAVASHPQPHMVVQSSARKYHIYWLVEPYASNEFYTIQQRKLAQLYNGDKKIIDPTRVLRVPGFYHLKAEPFLITCWSIYQGARWPVQVIADSLAHINAITHIGSRSPLGDPEMAAPSLEWLRFALSLTNPNNLDRQEWLSMSAAFKQAGWTLADEATLIKDWENWCNQYEKNDVGENLKLWNSIRETEVGWATFLRRTPVGGYIDFGANPPTMNGVIAQAAERVEVKSNEVAGSTPAHPTTTDYQFPELLSAQECALWFKDCYLIERTAEIFSPSGRYMNSTQFNAKYGGKHFIITTAGKATDDAWKAATRSTVFKVPQVDHVRFLPTQPTFAIITDRMGRKGLNTYIPVKYDAKEGDVSRWIEHVEKILPDKNDRDIWLSYMAHCIKFPGYKIQWAPLMQSVQGVGKTVFYEIMRHALGNMYVYKPQAKELVSSGSKFNAWMRGKLCIVVDEIKIDERRELVEILKPMITDREIEVQGKGVDQEMEDNVSNWLFFSNHKDAVPVNVNDRRYCILYSAIQSKSDLDKLGMGGEYFNTLFKWLEHEGGVQAVTHWFLNYPVKEGSLPVRAPMSSSYEEAIRISRSPMQVIIEEAVEDELQGFRGGYVSSLAVMRRVTSQNMKAPSINSIRTVLETMGYHELGRAVETYSFEDIMTRPIIYANADHLTLEEYGRAQGYDTLASK